MSTAAFHAIAAAITAPSTTPTASDSAGTSAARVSGTLTVHPYSAVGVTDEEMTLDIEDFAAEGTPHAGR
jgi:hypothetical protein